MSGLELSHDGERLIPRHDREELIYSEHFVRYLFATAYVSGMQVLDVASGAGYGSRMLKRAGALQVVGVDRSAPAVLYSRSQYGAPGVQFVVGDAGWLPLQSGSFDVAVSFETIEHLIDPQKFLEEIRRVLKPGGLFIVSTPNKSVYPQGNPFHLKEFYLEELEAELGKRFSNLQILPQDNWVASAIVPPEVAAQEHEIPLSAARVDKVSGLAQERSLYFVAICSNAPLPQVNPQIVLADVSDLRLANERSQALHVENARLRKELASTEEERQLLEAHLNKEVRLMKDARAELERKMRRDEETLASLGEEMERLVEQSQAREAELSSQLDMIRESLLWQLIGRIRRVIEVIAPRGSVRRRAYAGLLSRLVSRRPTAGSLAHIGDASDPIATMHPLAFPDHQDPQVSIIVAVRDQFQFTYNCLASIIDNSDGIPYEVIVVDDASSDETGRMLERVYNLRLVTNHSNLGFLESCNRGAAVARGRYVIFLNNDTEVEPGWLPPLVQLANTRPDVGMVGAKLVYPDGTLQEAGSIVWKDGSGWNYGRNEDPRGIEFNYVREVDYCSAACLLVKKDIFEKAGGFDKRYSPAYYEDTDLAFRLRELGYKTLYQPKSQIVHFEGVSHGKDEDQGQKRFQSINRDKFVAKWREVLERDQFPGPEYIVRARDRRAGQRLLVVDHIVPLHDRDSGSCRMYHFMRLLTELGFTVSFIPDSRSATEPYTSELQNMGVEVVYGAKDTEDYLKQIGPYLRASILSRPTVAWKYVHYLRELAPSSAIFYDTVDLHFLREGRRAKVENRESLVNLSNLYRELELALVKACDASITVTQEERKVLHEHVPTARVHVVPNIHEPVSQVVPYSGRKDLLFVGNFLHTPNRDSVRYLVERIWPLIKTEIPGCVLHIVGSDTPEEVRRLAREDIKVAGWVPDLARYLEGCRLFVAPLRYGAGLKGKVGQAMAHGLPTVTTTIGAEGMNVVDGCEMLIADDPLAFSARVVSAYRDPRLWARLSDNGIEHIKAHYAPAAVRALIEEMLGETQVLPT